MISFGYESGAQSHLADFRCTSRVIRKILKSRICEKIIANCEEWYRKVGSRICEIANCEDRELRGIPVSYKIQSHKNILLTRYFGRLEIEQVFVAPVIIATCSQHIKGVGNTDTRAIACNDFWILSTSILDKFLALFEVRQEKSWPDVETSGRPRVPR